MEYLQQEVLQAQLLKKKYQDIEQFDLNQDLESTGVETEEQLHAGSLFLEYKQFVEVDRREDLAGNPPIWERRANLILRQESSQLVYGSQGRHQRAIFLSIESGRSGLDNSTGERIGEDGGLDSPT